MERYCDYCGKLIEENDIMLVFHDYCFDCFDCRDNYVEENTEFILNKEEDE